MTRYVNIRGPAGYIVPSDDSLAGLPTHNVKSTPLTHEEMNRNLVTMAGAISDLEKYQLPATASVSVDEGKLRYNAATKEVEVNDGAGWTRTAEFESHQHPQSDIIGLELGIAGAISSKADIASPNLLGTPTAPTAPAAQTGNAIATLDFVHANDAILQTAIDGKANSSHIHTIANVTGLQGELDLKASLTDLSTAVSDVVRTSGTQIISGAKSFLDDVKVTKVSGEARVEAVWNGTNPSSCYVYNTSGSAGLYDSVYGPVIYMIKGVNAGASSVVIGGSGALNLKFNIGGVEVGALNSSGNLTANGDATFNSVRVGLGSAGIIYNTVVGAEALASANWISAARNTAIGYRSLKLTTTGGRNTAVGSETLSANTTGYENTAVGAYALYNNITGLSNTAVGSRALEDNATGHSNTAVGAIALSTITTGHNNTAVGFTALNTITTGDNNTAVGGNALSQSNGEANTAVGVDCLVNANTASYCTGVGVWAMWGMYSYTNSSAFGYDARVTGSNQVQLGSANTTTYVYGTVQDRSDIRDKADVRDTILGLDFIESLRPVDYKWDMRDSYREAPSDAPVKPTPVDQDADVETKANYEILKTQYEVDLAAFIERNKLENIVRDGSKKRSRYHHGLIAQEVKELLDTKGIDFGGFQDHKVAGGDDVMSIGYDELIAPLIKAVQELSARVKELEASAATVNSTP